MYIYTVKYRSRNLSNTHEPGDKGERSIGVKGQHRSTQLQFTTLLRSMQQELRPSPLTSFLHSTTCQPRDIDVATTRLSTVASSRRAASDLKALTSASCWLGRSCTGIIFRSAADKEGRQWGKNMLKGYFTPRSKVFQYEMIEVWLESLFHSICCIPAANIH